MQHSEIPNGAAVEHGGTPDGCVDHGGTRTPYAGRFMMMTGLQMTILQTSSKFLFQIIKSRHILCRNNMYVLHRVLLVTESRTYNHSFSASPSVCTHFHTFSLFSAAGFSCMLLKITVSNVYHLINRVAILRD